MKNMLYKPISEVIQLIVAADEVKGLKSVTFHDQPWRSVKTEIHVKVSLSQVRVGILVF